MEIKNEHAGIASLAFSHGFLYIGCIDGTLLIIDYNEGKEELKDALASSLVSKKEKSSLKSIFLHFGPQALH